MSKSNVGEVVSVLSAAGEIVGRLESFEPNCVVLDNPRSFVQTEDASGFLPVICMSGQVNPKEATICNFIVVQPVNDQVEKGWIESTSGIVLS